MDVSVRWSEVTPPVFSSQSFIQRPNLASWPFETETHSSDRQRRQSGVHRVQCIGAVDSPPSQQPGQASGNILAKSHVRWLGESEQQPGASG
ncbi:hypothetical protein TNCV_2817931 [Trichonephila clavipes]|nr:hypothetical protein TNCV_2817931 [Trichonephila clavipes]